MKFDRLFFFLIAVTFYVGARAVSEEELGLSGNDIYNAIYGSVLAAIIVFFGLPKLLYKNRPWYFVGFCFLCISIFTITDELFIDLVFRGPEDPRRFISGRGFRWAALNALFASFAITTFVAMFDNLESRRKLTTVIGLHREAELAALKLQLNPHTILNTLNNLYGLALEKNKKTPDAILRLTDILRYSLYEASDSSTSLSKEIQVLKSYITLQEIGIGERAIITFHIEGSIENRYIAPLLLLPIIENAFKHGSAITENTPTRIAFHLQVYENRISLVAENPYRGQSTPDSSCKGVGLDNLKDRLHLLYPKRHKLSVVRGEKVFRVSLDIVGEPL